MVTSMRNHILGSILFLAIAPASCGAPGAPFAGDYTGTQTSNATITAPATANGATSVQTQTRLLHVEPSTVAGVDLIAQFEGEPCIYNFVRSGDTAMVMASTTCDVSNMDTLMFMGMTSPSSSMTSVTLDTGTLSIAGNTITFASSGTVTSETMPRGGTASTLSATYTSTYTGTRH